MGKRSRQRAHSAGPAGPADRLTADDLRATYTDDAAGSELILRGVLTLKSRERYAQTLRGGGHQDDAWQRATELLFEQLAASWTINGVRTEKPQELLARYRAATPDERRFVRDALRAHVAECFPDLQAP